jgi:hypothetical protein
MRHITIRNFFIAVHQWGCRRGAALTRLLAGSEIRRKLGDVADPKPHWQSPARYHNKLPNSPAAYSEATRSRVVTLGVWHGAAENGRFLDDGRIPNVRGVRVHASTGYNPVEGKAAGVA